MNDRTIAERYNHWCGHREPFLRQARDNEALTKPVGVAENLDLLATSSAVYEGALPEWISYQTTGASVMTEFVAAILNDMMPARSHWVRFESLLEAGDISETDLEALRQLEMQHRIMTHNVGVTSSSIQALDMACVTGASVMHLMRGDTDTGVKMPRTRVFSLQDFVMWWRDGILCKLIVREVADDEMRHLTDNPTHEDMIYTEIDYEADTVRQERDGKVVDIDRSVDNPRRWVPVTFSKPLPRCHYPRAFVTDQYPLLLEHNNLSRAKQELIIDICRRIYGVLQEEGHDPDRIAELPSGSFIELTNPNGIFQVSKQQEMNTLQAILQEWVQQRNDLRDAFMAGLLHRRPLPRTATLTEEMAEERGGLTARHLAHLSDNFQRPLAWGILDLMEFDRSDIIDVIILTGLSAFSRQQGVAVMMQSLMQIMQMNPEFRMKIQWDRVFERAMDASTTPTEGILVPGARLDSIVQQIVAAAEDDPRVVPILMQLMQQAIGEQQQTQQPAQEPQQTTPQQPASAGPPM